MLARCRMDVGLGLVKGTATVSPICGNRGKHGADTADGTRKSLTRAAMQKESATGALEVLRREARSEGGIVDGGHWLTLESAQQCASQRRSVLGEWGGHCIPCILFMHSLEGLDDKKEGAREESP